MLLRRTLIGATTILQVITALATSCQCGYSLASTSVAVAGDFAPAAQTYTFTEILETDFLHVYTLPTDATSDETRIDVFGWQAQVYNVSPADARGPYGKTAEIENVLVNPLKTVFDWGGEGTAGGDPGLQMWVRGKNNLLNAGQTQFIRSSEMAVVRQDMLYGSYRVGMKMPDVAGTCTAFFWYRNNTSEVDLEFLSRELNTTNATYPASLNLVLQTPESAQQGYDASKTPYFKVQPLPFTPSSGYHEYRFDWLEDSVTFFADGESLFTITDQSVIPKDPGHLIINHWSNGDPNWSGGPPNTDTVATISYVKAYFNSSDPSRQTHFSSVCKAGGQVCAVVEPDFTKGIDPSGPNGNSTGRTPFLATRPGWNAAESSPNNHDGEEGGASRQDWSWRLAISMGAAGVVAAMLMVAS
ncbi:hypothetical protein ANO11243_086850 [Dothideomycetidae sp. 11243]|nr:hypothetical protein ANO11243_086850 [fungal sp. No.11243]